MMGSIIEWSVDMSKYAVYRFSKTSSIVDWDSVNVWWICGRRSDFIYSS